jgi:hypothetical protein
MKSTGFALVLALSALALVVFSAVMNQRTVQRNLETVLAAQRTVLSLQGHDQVTGVSPTTTGGVYYWQRGNHDSPWASIEETVEEWVARAEERNVVVIVGHDDGKE